MSVPAGYGFVDFDSPASAQKAVTALKAGGVQAQMAKVRAPLDMSIFGGFIIAPSLRLLVSVKFPAHEQDIVAVTQRLSKKLNDESLTLNQKVILQSYLLLMNISYQAVSNSFSIFLPPHVFSLFVM